MQAQEALTWVGGIITGVIALLTGANSILRSRSQHKVDTAVNNASTVAIRGLARQVNSLEQRLTRLRADFDNEREARIAAEDGEAEARRALSHIRTDLLKANSRIDALEKRLRNLGHDPEKL